jgi:hypothetical protein
VAVDSVYRAFEGFAVQLSGGAGLNHGVVVTEQGSTTSLVVLANDTLRVCAVPVNPGAHAVWAGYDRPGILCDDGPLGSTIWGMSSDGVNRMELLRVNGVVHTPMVSRDGKTFAYIMQETGNDTCWIVRHNSAGAQKWLLQLRSTVTEASMSDLGDAFFCAVYTRDGLQLRGLWVEADTARWVPYVGHYRAALHTNRRTLIFSMGSGGWPDIKLIAGTLDSQTHQMVAWDYTATGAKYRDAAYGPNGDIYCIADGQLQNRGTGRILTTGPATYAWPNAQ